MSPQSLHLHFLNKAALACDAIPEDSLLHKVESLIELSRRWRELGENTKAEAALDEATQRLVAGVNSPDWDLAMPSLASETHRPRDLEILEEVTTTAFTDGVLLCYMLDALAHAWIRLNDPISGLRCLNKAIIDGLPTWRSNSQYCAVTLAKLGQTEKALATLEYVASPGRRQSGKAEIARILMQSGQADWALKLYQEVWESYQETDLTENDSVEFGVPFYPEDYRWLLEHRAFDLLDAVLPYAGGTSGDPPYLWVSFGAELYLAQQHKRASTLLLKFYKACTHLQDPYTQGEKWLFLAEALQRLNFPRIARFLERKAIGNLRGLRKREDRFSLFSSTILHFIERKDYPQAQTLCRQLVVWMNNTTPNPDSDTEAYMHTDLCSLLGKCGMAKELEIVIQNPNSPTVSAFPFIELYAHTPSPENLSRVEQAISQIPEPYKRFSTTLSLLEQLD